MLELKDLEVWKAAMDLTQHVYEVSRRFPEVDNQGLGFQIRQTVVLVPSNIAAAASRKYGKESLKTLSGAKDALYQTETMLYLAERLHYSTTEELEETLEMLDTARRLLFGFIKHYKRTSQPERSRREYETEED